MNSPYISLLGLARRAGKVETGDEASRSACSHGLARALLIAGDASDRTRETFEFIAESAGLPCITVAETREELGNALGKRPCAVVSICDTGFSAAIIKKLADENEFAKALLPTLEKKAARARSRKKAKSKK